MGVTKRGHWSILGALAVLAPVAAADLGCAAAEVPAQQPTISLRMEGTPPHATVIVDEEAVGQLDFVSAHGIALPPGIHHVTVTAKGYFPWDKELEAPPGSPPIRLPAVTLVPVPD
jgi:hypothetical protein